MGFRKDFACNVYWPFAQKLKRENAEEALKKLRISQWMSRDELYEMQWKLVRKTLNNGAREIPYYRQKFTDIGWDFSNKDFSYADFLKIPKLEKEIVRDQLRDLLFPGAPLVGPYVGRCAQRLLVYGLPLCPLESREHDLASQELAPQHPGLHRLAP